MKLIAGLAAVVIAGNLFGQGSLYRPDPAHFVCNHCSLAQLVRAAFGIRSDQLSGPSFLDRQLVDASADIPSGATEEQYQQILRNVLRTRLGLVVHHEQKNIPAFDLIVAEGGPRLNDAAAADPFGVMPKSNGRPEDAPAAGRIPTMTLHVENGVAMIQGNATLATLANALSNQLRQRIRDSTGLAGKYTFALTWQVDSSQALNLALSRLGLALAPTTVLDRYDRGRSYK